MSTTDKAAIRHLVDLCVLKGISRVIISPGSRNAPLSIAFHQHPDIATYVIPDERVAAFIAMGMSQQDHSPTAIACTSGSALLNYAPAVAEAFYLRIPLLVISADRPQEWIDQMEGQTMHQRNSLANFTNYEITLPQEADGGDDLWYSDRVVNQAIDMTMYPKPGPVHINVPLKEPLYGRHEGADDGPKVITQSYAGRMALEDRQVQPLIDELARYERVMIVVGVFPEGKQHLDIFSRLTEQKNVVLLCESTSNLHGERVNTCIDRSLESISEDYLEDYIPELVITFGGPVISKKIKRLMRVHRPKSHWHIDRAMAHIDPFQSQTRAIQAEPMEVLRALVDGMAPLDDRFAQRWTEVDESCERAHAEFMRTADWSDLKVTDLLHQQLPGKSTLQMASSSPVRYIQLLKARQDLRYFSNRGVSGIDGCTSTAVGMAMNTDEVVTILTGDMSFYYDSNALWHKYLPANLRIIVINNSGGGIFRIIPGPRQAPELEDYFEAHMPNPADKLATAFGIDYLSARDEESLSAGLRSLYAADRPTILEVFTPRMDNPKVLDAYFAHLKMRLS